MLASIARLAKRLFVLSQKDTWHLRRAIYNGLQIGRDCRIFTTALGSEPYLVSIGNHVTLSKDVELITHDGGVWVFREEYPDLDLPNRIDIGSNVFIGAKSIILPGTLIHDNVVVGAGSVVKGELEGGWVYAGIPARKIKLLEDYRRTCLNNGINTKQLTEHKKKELLLSRFPQRSP